MTESLNVNSKDNALNEVNIKRLGQQQKDILRFMYNGFVCQQVDVINTLDGQVTDSRKASVSRTIKQLRGYGLITEIPEDRPQYTITDLGKRFVESDNRFDIQTENQYPYEYRHISIDDLRIDKCNMRGDTTPGEGLTESIKTNGLLQPLIVRQTPGEFGYRIIDGSKRFAAIKDIFYHEDPSWDKIDCRILYDVSDSDALELFTSLNVNWDNTEQKIMDY